MGRQISRRTVPDSSEESLYYIYIHTVPNGKIYIGVTNRPYQRWNNGNGYRNNEAFYNDIVKYGWDAIKHEILMTFKDYEQALAHEKIFIILYDSENPLVGYNNTTYKKDMIERYTNKRPYVNGEEDEYLHNLFRVSFNPFYVFNIPISEADKFIDEWIYDERNRTIAKERFLNGKTMTEISKICGISARRINTIVSELVSDIERHI